MTAKELVTLLNEAAKVLGTDEFKVATKRDIVNGAKSALLWDGTPPEIITIEGQRVLLIPRGNNFVHDLTSLIR